MSDILTLTASDSIALAVSLIGAVAVACVVLALIGPRRAPRNTRVQPKRKTLRQVRRNVRVSADRGGAK